MRLGCGRSPAADHHHAGHDDHDHPRSDNIDCGRWTRRPALPPPAGQLPQTGDGGPRPDQLYIDADLSADEYAEKIAERTFVATATVTIDGQDLDDLESLVEGQPVPLAVVLEQVGGSEAIRDVLAESFPDEQLVDFTRLNRVTITCDKPDGDDSAGCSDFDVTPAFRELQWPEREFEFEFTPRRDGEIKIKVRVEGLVIEAGSLEKETAYVAVDNDFTVVVDVHPEQVEWNAFQASVRGPAPGLMVNVPDTESVRVAETLEVSSTFTYPDGVVPEIPIGIELQLEREADGADASITPNESRQEAGSIHQSWLVTPNEQGALGLLFSYGASATVLDVDVSARPTQPIVKSFDVLPAPVVGESLPSRVWNGSVRAAAGVGTLLATGITAGGLYAKHRRKLAKLGVGDPPAE